MIPGVAIGFAVWILIMVGEVDCYPRPMLNMVWLLLSFIYAGPLSV